MHIDLSLHLVLQKYDVLLYTCWILGICPVCSVLEKQLWPRFDSGVLTFDRKFGLQFPSATQKSPPWGYLQEGMLFNHFQKNRELTTKVGLTNNLRRPSWSSGIWGDRGDRAWGCRHRWMRCWLVTIKVGKSDTSPWGFLSTKHVFFFGVWSKQDSSTDLLTKLKLPASKIIPYRWAEAANFTKDGLKTNITTLQIDGLED